MSTTVLIPGLPDDVSTQILLSIPFPHHPLLRRVSRRWSILLSASSALPLRLSLPLPPLPLLVIFPSDPSTTPPLLFCPLTLSFCTLPPLPCSSFLYNLTKFAPLSVPPFIYLLGGSMFDARSYPLGRPSASNEVFRLDLSGMGSGRGWKWEIVEYMKAPRGSFACARTRDRDIVVAGGGSRHSVFPSHGSRISSVERYFSKSGKWENLQNLPKYRAGCVGFTKSAIHTNTDTSPSTNTSVNTNTNNGIEEEFWVMGGYGEYTTLSGVVPADVYYRDAAVLELKTSTWRSVPDMWAEGERVRLGPLAVVEGVDGMAREVFMLDDNQIFRYNFNSNVWQKETTLRKNVPDNDSCGFAAMNGEIYVLTSALKSDGSDFKRPYRRRPTIEIQVYCLKMKKWRFYIVHPPMYQPIDFKSAIVCTLRV